MNRSIQCRYCCC